MKVLTMTYKDSTDYLGNLILKNNHPSQYLFEGGYASFDADTLNGWHYYVQDYMGNNRMVVNARTNSVEQETHYYPYGGVIGDLSSGENLQPYKFEGKVLAAMEKIDNLRREDKGNGAIPKHYRLENGNAIDCVDGINRSFINGIDNAYSKTQKDKIFIHRTNNDGKASGAISTGCILIGAKDYSKFEQKIGHRGFLFILQRK